MKSKIPVVATQLREMMTMSCIVAILTAMSWLHVAEVIAGGLYLSQHQVFKLHETNQELIRIMQSYLSSSEHGSGNVADVLHRMEMRQYAIGNDHETFFLNPLNSLMTIERLYMDVHAVAALTKGTCFTRTHQGLLVACSATCNAEHLDQYPSGSKNGTLTSVCESNGNQTSLSTHLSLTGLVPDEIDVKYTRIAMLRLQDFYLLDTGDLANGMLVLPERVAAATSRMTAAECRQMGFEAIRDGRHEHAASWFRESLKRDEVYGEMISTESNDMNMHALRNVITETEEEKKLLANWIEEQRSGITTTAEKPDFDEEEHKVVKSLCNGSRKMTVSHQSKLKCFYWKSRKPFLALALIKAEEVSRERSIFIFHEILSDHEIELLLKVGSEGLEYEICDDSSYFDHEEYNEIKSCKKVRFSPGLEISRVLHRRVQDVTGLVIGEPEDAFGLRNYGIGGFSGMHADTVMEENDRMATWIYYLTDVEAGGGLVFANIDALIPAVRGTAAFWFNLLPDGREDVWKLHAACPVLYGNKWIAGKFPTEHANVFTRPCGLEPDPHDSF